MPEIGPPPPTTKIGRAPVVSALRPAESPIQRAPVDILKPGPVLANIPKTETNSPPKNEKPKVEQSFKGDYYAWLGVPRDASAQEIAKAMREQAKRFHPDVSKEENAEERFKDINEAYQVLSNPERRAKYDKSEQVKMERAVATAQGASNIMGRENIKKFSEAALLEVSGKPASELTGNEIVQYVDAAVLASAANLVENIQNNQIYREIKGPPAEVLKILLESKNINEAEIYLLMIFLLAIINMLQYIQGVVANDKNVQANALSEMGDNALTAGGLLGALKGTHSIQEAANKFLNKIRNNVPVATTPIVTKITAEPPQPQPDRFDIVLSPKAEIISASPIPAERKNENEIVQVKSQADLLKEQQIKVAQAALVTAITAPKPAPIPVDMPRLEAKS
jgi:hypothetical protein